MRIQMITSAAGPKLNGGQPLISEGIYDVSDEEAQALIEARAAVAVAPPPEPQPAPAPSEPDRPVEKGQGDAEKPDEPNGNKAPEPLIDQLAGKKGRSAKS